MEIVLGEELKAVLEFMERTVPVDRLMDTVAGLHAVAPLMWGDAPVISLRSPPISSTASRPGVASESGLALGAGGGSVAEADCRH